MTQTAASSRRDELTAQTSTFVVRPDQHERDRPQRRRPRRAPAGPSSEDVISRITPGAMTFIEHDRRDADAGDDVGREHDAGQQRADLAPIRSLRASSVPPSSCSAAHGVAAGALLDDDRRHQHRDLARRQPLLQALERVAPAAGRRASPATTAAARRRPGRRARAPPSAPPAAIESPACVPLESIRASSGSWSMNASRRCCRAALDVPAQRRRRRSRRRRRTRSQRRRTGASSSKPTSEPATTTIATARPAISCPPAPAQPRAEPRALARAPQRARRARAIRPVRAAPRRSSPARARPAPRARLEPPMHSARPISPSTDHAEQQQRPAGERVILHRPASARRSLALAPRRPNSAATWPHAAQPALDRVRQRGGGGRRR